MENKLVEVLSAMTTSTQEILGDILVLQFTIVNACIVGDPAASAHKWVLVDTGLENSADYIISSVEKRFGKGTHPQAIVLTHGHFDHVGSVKKLAQLWDVPVYAHELEVPYLTGEKDYPLGDPSVGGGLVARMSPTFPHTAIDIGNRLATLPADGSIPGMVGWKWVHTPGHTEGHVSLFRESDRTLIVGDAFTTTDQESLLSVITQRVVVGGPPAYLTTDWDAAEDSVQRLKNLNPEWVIPSHGKPLRGQELTEHLQTMATHFDEMATPNQGRFVDHGDNLEQKRL